MVPLEVQQLLAGAPLYLLYPYRVYNSTLEYNIVLSVSDQMHNYYLLKKSYTEGGFENEMMLVNCVS